MVIDISAFMSNLELGIFRIVILSCKVSVHKQGDILKVLVQACEK